MLNNLLDRFVNLFLRKNRSNDSNTPILKNLGSLQALLGFRIINNNYYVKALTHRSYLEINPALLKSNERLEFLGDSVLNMIVGHYLFENYDDEGEGFLTKARSSLVNRDRLYAAADKLQLKGMILYNQKYLSDSEDGLQTILADSVEALIGAIYLDRGLREAKKFVLKWLVYPYEEDESFLIDTNYKGQLLEFTHAKRIETPRYVLKNVEGPDHKKEFTVEVFIGNELMGTGQGKNKKTAEQNASKTALSKLKVI
ncbi:MAG: ribonuclease III [Ignavibacteriales bacterium]|nr:ribonuclease III [Ignavibacteriales bacterium]